MFSFYPESKFRERYPILLKYKSALAQTIAFYRNRNALEAFLNGCAYASGNYERQKALCKRFGDCFAYMRERIHDQSIKDTLDELLDSCEEVSPIIGIDQTAFYEPATEQDLQECEARTGIIIPRPMREFLMFSNGATLFQNSTTIYAASEIGKYTLDGYEVHLTIGQDTITTVRTDINVFTTRTMDTAARIVNDHTYIPIRFVAEALGFDVVWKDNILTVATNAAYAPFEFVLGGVTDGIDILVG